MTVCPKCSSEQVVKNGRIDNGKQNHRCRACERQFVPNPTKKVISDKTKRRSDRLLLAKLPLAGSARATLVSESWLQGYLNQAYEGVEQRVEGRTKKGALVMECDEAWSFVGSKQNRQWVWLALDRTTRQIVGCHVGSRDEEAPIGLWRSLPECYLDAETFVDFWKAYDAIF